MLQSGGRNTWDGILEENPREQKYAFPVFPVTLLAFDQLSVFINSPLERDLIVSFSNQRPLLFVQHISSFRCNLYDQGPETDGDQLAFYKRLPSCGSNRSDNLVYSA